MIIKRPGKLSTGAINPAIFLHFLTPRVRDLLFYEEKSLWIKEGYIFLVIRKTAEVESNKDPPSHPL